MKLVDNNKKYILTERLLLMLLIVFAVFGSLGPLLIGQYNLALLGSYLGVPMLIAPLIWLRLRAKETVVLSVSDKVQDVLKLFFFLAYLCSILILYYFPVRTIAYYLLVAVMGVLILSQILFSAKLSNKQVKLILVQIILLFLNIIWGVTLKYYLFIGRTDIFFHTWAIESLLSIGRIDQTFDVYEAFPLWHILCAFVYQLTNSSILPAKVMFITNGLIYGCLLLTVYLAASKILKRKIALLSALLMCFNTDVVFYGMYSIPRSVVFCLEALLLLLLIKKKTRLNIALLQLFIIGLVIYHTASMPFIIVILALFYMLQKFYNISNTNEPIDFNFLVLMVVTTLTYWMYAGEKVFHSLAEGLLREAPSGILTKSIVQTPWQELFNYLQYSPLLLFVIVGVLWGLSASKFSELGKLIILMGLLLVPVTFPGPALLFNKLAGNMNFARFGEYSFLFICLAGAAGLYILFYKFKTKFKLVVIYLFFIMAFLAVSNDFTASDNPLVKRPFYTFYLSQEEDRALQRLAQMTEGYLMSDYTTCRYLENSSFVNKIHVLEVNGGQQKFLKSSNQDLILFRKAELKKRPLKLFTAPGEEFLLDPTVVDKVDYYHGEMPLWSTLQTYNTIYDSGAVTAFK